MPEILDALRQEHRNMARLLSVLERELSRFDRAERPDYDVLTGIAEYFTGFPARCHHPKEDLIHRRLKERAPEAAERILDLEAEHTQLAERVEAFKQAVANVIAEAEMPRDAFADALRSFIADQRSHMERENQVFFPTAIDVLSADDWAEIDAEASRESDPLFGPETSEEFRELSESILRWEKEDVAAGN